MPPVLNSIPTQRFGEGNPVSINLASFVASGTPIISYAIASGTLPTGLTFNITTWVISGSSTVLGTTSLTVTATNASGTSTPATAFDLIIQAGPVMIAIPNQTANQYLWYELELSAYTTPAPTWESVLGYEITSGTLPSGLSLNTTTGHIYGRAKVDAVSSISVRAIDIDGAWNTVTIQFTVLENLNVICVPYYRARYLRRMHRYGTWVGCCAVITPCDVAAA